MYRKWKSYDIWFLRDGVPQTEFVVILGHFCTLTPLTTWRSKIEKNEKNAWEYHHFTLIYHKWKSYDVWLLRYGAQQIFFFFVILGHFLPFYPPNNPKNQNFGKIKKKNHNHKLYCSWHMVHDRCNSKLCMLTPLTAWKIKILKKWNNQLEIPSFYTCVPNIVTTW